MWYSNGFYSIIVSDLNYMIFLVLTYDEFIFTAFSISPINTNLSTTTFMVASFPLSTIVFQMKSSQLIFICVSFSLIGIVFF